MSIEHDSKSKETKQDARGKFGITKKDVARIVEQGKTEMQVRLHSTKSTREMDLNEVSQTDAQSHTHMNFLHNEHAGNEVNSGAPFESEMSRNSQFQNEQTFSSDEHDDSNNSERLNPLQAPSALSMTTHADSTASHNVSQNNHQNNPNNNVQDDSRGKTLGGTHEHASVSVSSRLGQLQFHASGKFRVLQVSDIQEAPKVSKDTIRLIEAACDASRPDIVIFTGNQIAGYDSAYEQTFIKRSWLERRTQPMQEEKEHTKQLVRQTLAQFLAPLVNRRIPFAVTFGNHDFQCGLTLDELTDIYREFPGCVNPRNASSSSASDVKPSSSSDNRSDDTNKDDAQNLLVLQKIYDSYEPGTFALPVRDQYNEKNLIGLTIMNSGDYAQEGGYAQPSAIAMRFLRTSAREMDTRAMVFQHMPVRKFYELLKMVPMATANAIQGYRAFEAYSYVLDETKTFAGSYLGEGISCPDKDSGEFRLLQENNYFAVAAGHDHRNAIAGVVDGILLTSAPTAGFGTYGPNPERRAVRLFEFDVRHPYEPRTQLLEFGEIVGKPSGSKAYALASTYMPNNTGEAINLLRKPRVLASVAAIVAGIVSIISFGRKKK